MSALLTIAKMNRLKVLALGLAALSPILSVFAERVVPSERVETRLRVRQEPNTDSAVVGFLEPDESAVYVAAVPWWYEIELTSGSRGFVSKAWSSVFPDAAAKTLRVGAWNIRKLGHGNSKNYALVASIIEENFDVLAVVEVMQKQGTHPGYDELLTALGDAWRGVVTPEPRPNTNSGSSEFYAVFFRSALVDLAAGVAGLSYHVDHDGSEDGAGDDFFSREPAFTWLRSTNGNFDFAVAAYHATWAEGDATVIADEVEELDDVMTAMGLTFPSEQDVLLLGDFNLVPADLEHTLGMESLITGTGSTLNTTGARTQNHYDHLLIRDLGKTRELIGNGEVLDVRNAATSEEVFFQTASDHLPIRAHFRIDQPDDD